MFDIYVLSVLAFFVLIAVLLVIDRKNIEVNSYVLFMRRTQRGRGLIDRIASASETFWSKVGVVSSIVGVGGMVFAIVFIGYIFTQQIIGPPMAEGPALVIPSPSGEAIARPGVIAVPFWEWIISILILIVVHEGMHGIMVNNVKSKIKSLGVALFAVIPGAFVEPDEEDLNKKNWKEQIQVYSAGSFGNFCLAVIVLLFMNFAFLPVFTIQSVGYMGYVNATEYGIEAFPAEEVNMTGEILSISGHRTHGFGDFQEVLGRYSPGDTVDVETTDSSFTLVLAENPDEPGEPFLGIAGVSETYVLRSEYKNTRAGSVIDFFRNLLSWLFVLNLGIGIMNLLPLKPLDGGLILESLSERFYPKKSEQIVRIVSTVSLALLVMSLAVSFIL